MPKRLRLIEARKRLGLKQPAIAEKMGVSVPQVSRWENGHDGIPSQRVPSLLDAYQANLEEVFEDISDGSDSAARGDRSSRVRSEVRATGSVGFREVDEEFHGTTPLPDLKLLGSAVGGELEDDVELTELYLNEVLEYLNRPASLANDNDAYALTVVGSSMLPRFKPRERIMVSPRASIGVGDDVVVQLRSEDGDDERITMVLIKELVRKGSDFYELRQWNPERIFRVEAKRVAHAHKVVGIYIG